jgi:hypothetical protein
MPSLQKALPPELADNVLRVRLLLHLLYVLLGAVGSNQFSDQLVLLQC